MAANKGIYLIIPALNEEQNLRWLLPLVKENYGVVLVNNGSTDNTRRVALENQVDTVDCSNKGYGSAVLAGLTYINGFPNKKRPKIVVIFDADGTCPVESISTVTTPIQQDDCDFVIGQRTFCEKGSMPSHAKFGNGLQTFLIYLLTGFKFSDMGPLRAMKLDALNQLQMEDKTWGWNVEMQLKMVGLGFRIREVSIPYNKRRFGHSKISGSFTGSLRAGTKIIFAVFYYFFQTHKIRRNTNRKRSALRYYPKES